MHVLTFGSTRGPSGRRGEAVASPARLAFFCGAVCAFVAVHQMLSLNHSQRSCRPQPRGSGGDATPREDTRQDRWLYLNFPPPRTVAGWLFNVSLRMCNRTAVTTGVTGPNREGASLGGYDNRGVSRRERVLFPFWALRQVALKASELVAAQASSTGSRDPGAAQPVPEAVTRARRKGVRSCRGSRVAAPLKIGGHPPQGRPTQELAGD